MGEDGARGKDWVSTGASPVPYRLIFLVSSLVYRTNFFQFLFKKSYILFLIIFNLCYMVSTIHAFLGILVITAESATSPCRVSSSFLVCIDKTIIST